MFKATFSYDAENEDELSITEGDIINVIAQIEGGWWEGECNGRSGWFPSNFVVEVTDAPPPVVAPAPAPTAPVTTAPVTTTTTAPAPAPTSNPTARPASCML